MLDKVQMKKKLSHSLSSIRSILLIPRLLNNYFYSLSFLQLPNQHVVFYSLSDVFLWLTRREWAIFERNFIPLKYATGEAYDEKSIYLFLYGFTQDETKWWWWWWCSTAFPYTFLLILAVLFHFFLSFSLVLRNFTVFGFLSLTRLFLLLFAQVGSWSFSTWLSFSVSVFLEFGTSEKSSFLQEPKRKPNQDRPDFVC